MCKKDTFVQRQRGSFKLVIPDEFMNLCFSSKNSTADGDDTTPHCRGEVE